MNIPLSAAATATTAKDDPTFWRVDDALWALLEPLLKVDKERNKPGRPRRDDRAIFDGLIWLARTGSQWPQLPRECGPKPTVHERFTEWVATGALERAWAVLLREYDADIGLDWEWQAADGCIVKAPFGKKGGAGEAQATGRNPTDRGKPGTKRHLLTGAKGLPVSLVVTGANRHDMTQLAAPLDGTVVEPAPTAPPPGHPDRHPPRRWVVEVAHSWFNRFRRRLTRTEKRASHYLGFSHVAAVLITYRKVRHARSLSG